VGGGWRLALAAVGFWSGILWATGGERAVGLRAGVALLLAGLLVLLSGALARSSVGPTLFVAVFLAFGLLGAGWGSMRDARVQGSPIARLVGRPVKVVGTLASIPAAGTFGWTGAMRSELIHLDPGSSSGIRSGEALWLEGRGPPPRLPVGERIMVDGAIKRRRGSFGSFLRRRGYVATLAVDVVTDRGPPRNPFVMAANSLRRTLRSSLARVFPRKEAGLLMGLALGDTSGLDRRIEEDFRATGLSHLTAVSGENLVMFLAPILGLAGLAGAGRHARFAIGLGAVGFFVLLTGAEPSVLRAAAMSGLTLLGIFLGRPRSPPCSSCSRMTQPWSTRWASNFRWPPPWGWLSWRSRWRSGCPPSLLRWLSLRERLWPRRQG
jgi:competence protein ComEC